MIGRSKDAAVAAAALVAVVHLVAAPVQGVQVAVVEPAEAAAVVQEAVLLQLHLKQKK